MNWKLIFFVTFACAIALFGIFYVIENYEDKEQQNYNKGFIDGKNQIINDIFPIKICEKNIEIVINEQEQIAYFPLECNNG